MTGAKCEALRSWAARFIAAHTLPGNANQPLVIIQPWSKSRFEPYPVEFWDRWVADHVRVARFWQMSRIHDSAIQGCEYYALLGTLGSLTSEQSELDHWQAILASAKAFVGVAGHWPDPVQLSAPPLQTLAIRPNSEQTFRAELDRFLERALA